MPTDKLDQKRLRELILAEHPCILITTTEESYVLDLINVIALQESRRLRCWTSTRGFVEGSLDSNIHARSESENPSAGLYLMANQAKSDTLQVAVDLCAHFDHDPRHVRALRDTIEACRRAHSTLILIDHDDRLPPTLRDLVTPFAVSRPNAKEIEQIVRTTVQNEHLVLPVEVELRRRELDVIIRNLGGLTRDQAVQIVKDCICIDRVFNAEDLNVVMARKRQLMQHDGVLEYVEAPVTLDSIGGLENLKQWLEHRKGTLAAEASEFGLVPPRGVLLLGVQGAGKSLSAKAIATAWNRPLLRLDPSRLYDRYVGASEQRLREALEQAERMAPIVLWIDEIEKGFASAAARSNDGGLSQRMFGTLLTWMQEHREPVFLVATANNIDALPPELLRKGRFDEIFFVDLPDARVRELIFSIHLKKRKRDPEQFDLTRLATVSDGYSGAEIEQAVISALHVAFVDRAELTTEMIEHALEQSPPLSVTMAEKIEALRAWSVNRCMPANAVSDESAQPT